MKNIRSLVNEPHVWIVKFLIVICVYLLCLIFEIGIELNPNKSVFAQSGVTGIDITVEDACANPPCDGYSSDKDNLIDTENIRHRERIPWEMNCSISEPRQAGNGPFCIYHCYDDKLVFYYLEDSGEWAEITEGDLTRGMNNFNRAGDLPQCDWDPAYAEPCEHIKLRQDGTLICGGNYSVTASAQIPCVQVHRWPYPRGLVSMENEFEVLGPFEALGSASSREWCGDVRNYQLQVGWFMRNDRPPLWFFDERDWADEPNEDFGMRVTHTYQTSSWGLPENGPSLEGELILPAYQVRVGTAWQPYVRRSWETYERSERRTFDCEEGDRGCRELVRQCEDPGTDREHEDCFEWGWVTHDTGWQAIDLRSHGSFFPYYLSFQNVDITQPPLEFPPVPMAQRTCGDIAVPVIEIQVLLNAPEVTWEE